MFSPVPELAPGTRVVIVPNLRRCTDPACTACTNPRIGENYCPHNAFLSSGEDGLMQSLVELDAGNVVAVPEDVPSEVAVMTELLSIATGAIRRLDAPGPTSGEICVVGAGLRGTPGIAARVFSTISDINVMLISQGSSSINLTFVIEERQLSEAVSRLHMTFFEARDAEPATIRVPSRKRSKQNMNLLR